MVYFLLVHVLTGLALSCLSAILIYFKQKDLFHHSAILILVFMIYFFCHIFYGYIEKLSIFVRTAGLVLILFTCWLGPQFLYQVRPHTFYISGFAIGIITLMALSGSITASNYYRKYQWAYFFFLLGYLQGTQISMHILLYLIMGLSILLVIILGFEKTKVWPTSIILATVIASGLIFWKFSYPIVIYKEQASYEDKVVFTAETQYHQLVITQWHDDFWFYIDRLKNLSSIDEYLYYEPMVHSIFNIKADHDEALVIGGENGCLVREILKYEQIKHVDVISYDTLMRNLGMENQYFTNMNHNALNHQKVTVMHKDLMDFMVGNTKRYGAVFIDLPDPRSVETNQYYTTEFYSVVKGLIAEDGIMITQAGSPYFATEAFYAIGKTVRKSGFHILPIHNQVLTLGEWGWYICSATMNREMMKNNLLSPMEASVTTRWFNDEAAKLITAFGKTYLDTLDVGINSLDNPSVYQYYLKGNWNLN